MMVVFGFPSAEHVTMMAGTPLSSTGRISGGRRVRRNSLLHGRNETRSRARSGRLQVNLADLELDGQRRRLHERVQHVLGGAWKDRPDAPHETSPDAIDDVDVVAQRLTVAEVAAFELVGFVR